MTVDYERRGATAIITLNRPDKLNALTLQMYDQLAAAFETARTDAQVAAVVLTGAGEQAFCVGADLREAIPALASGLFDISRWDGAHQKHSSMDKPVIAALNGLTLGGGFEIMLSTDLRVAAPGAVFGLPEPKVGVVPAGGTLVRLTRQIPYARAMQLLLGRQIDAWTAERYGLINAVADDPLAVALQWAAEIGRLSGTAVAVIHRAVRALAELPPDAAFDAEAKLGQEAFTSADARAGLAAFAAGREPSFPSRNLAGNDRAAGPPSRPASHPKLDLVIENADVITMDARRPQARRVGVLHGRIVGLDDEIAGWDSRERIDLAGGCLLPGFIDAHTHLELTGQSLSGIDISGCTGVDAALELIARAAARVPAGDWIDVTGYDHGVLGRQLTAQELDAASGGRKVWVRQISSHASVVSTAVLDTLDPALLVGDRAAGLFKELEQNAVLAQRMPYPVEQVGQLVLLAAEQARREGITTCVDAGNGGEIGSLSALDGAAYLDLVESGRLPVRMMLMPSADVLRELPTHPDDGFRRGLPLGLRSGFGSDLLAIVAQKIVLDGGMQMQTARMSEPYVDSESIGMWREDPELMVHATVEGHRAGWQMALHAIGDAAVDLAIEAFEKAQAAWPRPDARHRIEHGGAIRDDQLTRLAALKVAVVSQPAFLYDFGDRYVAQLGPERASWLYRGRSLLEHGIRLVGSSDRPLPGAPLRAIQTMVTRTTSAGQVVAPDERVDVASAVAAFTVAGAWAIRRADRLGRIVPGYLADFTLLARNPMRVDASEIADIEVLGTVLDGRVRRP
jgi:predicted amidohydrolase YtcJ/enoyl-CoA hydratase/carnithine racemase